MVISILVAVALGQGDFSSPPMVPAPTAQPAPVPPPPPVPPPEPVNPGTPPPPTLTPQTTPSPYGQPKAVEEQPKVEYGLMISESLFGMLTSAGVSLLPYFLLLNNFVTGGSGGVFAGNDTIGWVVYCVLFAAIPLSVAQTEVSIANGSRWYYSETWPAALVGLGVEGAVLGLAYLTRGDNGSPDWQGSKETAPLVKQRSNPAVLLVGTIAVVPLAQMVIINLFKSPRLGKGSGGTALLNYREGHGVTVGVPNLAPIFSSTREGALSGAQFSLLSGRW